MGEGFAAQLAGIKGYFIRSLNEVPEVRATFAGFEMETASTFYTANRGKVTRLKELLISK